MTGHDDFDRTLAGWFEAEAVAPAPAGELDRVLDATRRRRPRPGWLARPGSDWVGKVDDAGPSRDMRPLPRLAVRWSTALVVLLAVMALVGGMILVGARLLQPSPLPGRLGQLAYGLDGDIFVADWDGRNRTRIADGAPADGPAACDSFFGAQWSPDGGHLLYRSAADGCPDTVFITDPAGRAVASFPGPGMSWSVRWSPDSTRVSMWVEPGRTIGLYGLDGVRQALVSVPPRLNQAGELDAVWSPDGRSLLLNLVDCSWGFCATERWELPVDGGPARRLPTDDPRSRQAVYSRDGTRVAFVGLPDSFSLVIAEADGTQLRVLPGAPNSSNEGPGAGEKHGSPLWSPSGDRVAFSRSVFDGSGREDEYGPLESAFELRVVEVSSGKVTTLVAGRDIHAIGFSPEGDRILFARPNNSLWSINTDGSNPQLLVAGGSDGAWQWRPADS